MRLTKTAAILLAITAGIVGCQLFVPPVVGLADQGDFVRVIGRFGYGQDPSPPKLKYAYVPSRFIPSNFRVRQWEQPTSESLFVGLAVLLNRLISKDGSLSILTIGLVHALAFLLVYARLLCVTKNFRAKASLWIGATVILTDVGYVAYWNSLYREPASLLFGLALMAETIEICRNETVAVAAVARWAVWSVLFVTAKEQNTLCCWRSFCRECVPGQLTCRRAARLLPE
jgi:hypothetical protein